MSLKFLDLFSGIGGFRYPLEKLGHKCIGFSEIDKYAIRTYKSNFDTSIELELGDIRNIIASELPDFNLLVAGFPCQAFSLAGKRLGFKDTRGTLFFEVARLLKDKQPEYFILENVKGLISHGKPNNIKKCYPSLVNKEYDGKKKGIGTTLKIIEETLIECGYTFYWQVLNTSNYGLPHQRERIIFVGQRSDLGHFHFKFPEKEKLQICVNDILEKQVDSKYYLSDKMTQRILDRLTTSINPNHIIDDRQSDLRVYKDISPTLRAARQGLYAVIPLCNTNPSGKGMNGQVFSTFGLSPTLTTNKGEGIKVGISDFNITSPITFRRLTPREHFRLQGFPDYFYENAKINNISDAQLYKQTGNTVSTNIIEKVLIELEHSINSRKCLEIPSGTFLYYILYKIKKIPYYILISSNCILLLLLMKSERRVNEMIIGEYFIKNAIGLIQ